MGGDQGESFQRVIAALESTGSRVAVSGSTAMAQCPSHDDANPSLSITGTESRVLIKCHGECSTEAVVEALGLSMADLFNDTARASSMSAPPVQVAEYIFRDEHSVPLFRVVRYDPKGFRQHRWNGTAWDPTLGNARRVLFRLPQLIAGIGAGQWAFIVEGEKDAERLAAEGLTATTVSMGANPGNWDATDTSVLDGAYVAVIGDNDRPGRRYARHAANSLYGRAAEVRLIQLSGLAENGDISDWLDNGNTSADLETILGSTQEWTLRRKFDGAEPFATVGDVSAYRADALRSWAEKPTTWRIRGVLVKDTHLVVGASKKTLKTTLVSGEMAYAIANGTPWLDHGEFVVDAPAPVIVVINEGVKSYMRTLARIPARHKADSLGPIYVIDASGVKLENGDLSAVIRETAERVGAGVIIYDAWYGFVGGDKKAESMFAMAEVFKVVQDVADELNVDPIIVHHLKKNSKGRPDLDDLTYAGVAEWADSWLLITHRSTARPDDGEYRLGLVAGSRQWGEIDYEVDASFGKLDLDAAGYTHPPRWLVTRVDASRSEQWSKGSGGSPGNPETNVTDFIAAHPYECTKSQVCTKAPGAEKTNRDAFERLINSGQLVVAKIQRREGKRTVLRDLVGPSDIDLSVVEQQRLAPIGNDLPTYVGQGGAGNSPEAAVSAPSEPQFGGNLGRTANVGNADTPTLSESTSASDQVPDQGSETTPHAVDVQDLLGSEYPPRCDKCGELHEPPLPGEINWKCFHISTERDLAKWEKSF